MPATPEEYLAQHFAVIKTHYGSQGWEVDDFLTPLSQTKCSRISPVRQIEEAKSAADQRKAFDAMCKQLHDTERRAVQKQEQVTALESKLAKAADELKVLQGLRTEQRKHCKEACDALQKHLKEDDSEDANAEGGSSAEPKPKKARTLEFTVCSEEQKAIDSLVGALVEHARAHSVSPSLDDALPDSDQLDAETATIETFALPTEFQGTLKSLYRAVRQRPSNRSSPLGEPPAVKAAPPAQLAELLAADQRFDVEMAAARDPSTPGPLSPSLADTPFRARA